MTRVGRRWSRIGRFCAAGSLLLGVSLGAVGCGAGSDGVAATGPAPSTGVTGATSSNRSPSASPSSLPAESSAPVREGHDARPDLAFQPAKIVLPGGRSAPVVPAQTVNGVLQIPEHVSTVGWWDGSADVGDPFGTTVIAGHIDSATEGLGFFARLLSLKKGDEVTVRGFAVVDPSGSTIRDARYRIISAKLVDKDALASDSAAFEQNGSPRLVLITCGGAFIPSKGGYQSNFVIIAVPA